ncbi:MAG: TIGR02450 family Trp-rich protein [Acidiferrobacteraceae bacterium]|nr:TIGR02450 family Trp-rich protein [Acidiferrobacteraceae bacterium]
MQKLNHLVNSKWTAVKPIDRSRHFELKALTEQTRQSAQVVCLMRCVVTRSLVQVCLDELLDKNKWRKGWFRGEPPTKSSESPNAG